jgi:tRNA-Thr(GGU) m(6)t(6)A37 methyltransferase TsaA
MNHLEYKVKVIGILKTEYETSENTPIQPGFSQSIGKAIIQPKYIPGLNSLNTFSHIYLIYWFHKAKEPTLLVTPYLDKEQHGLFATRAPARPNPIGISIVQVMRIENDTIVFKGADMLNNTPLLDIKPYTSRFDYRDNVRDGWLSGRDTEKALADNRFEK